MTVVGWRIRFNTVATNDKRKIGLSHHNRVSLESLSLISSADCLPVFLFPQPTEQFVPIHPRRLRSVPSLVSMPGACPLPTSVIPATQSTLVERSQRVYCSASCQTAIDHSQSLDPSIVGNAVYTADIRDQRLCLPSTVIQNAAKYSYQTDSGHSIEVQTHAYGKRNWHLFTITDISNSNIVDISNWIADINNSN